MMFGNQEPYSKKVMNSKFMKYPSNEMESIMLSEKKTTQDSLQVPFDTCSKESEKTIDFVIVYNENGSSFNQKKKTSEEQEAIRKVYESNLKGKGLMLEKEVLSKLCFIKIHAPRTVLRHYCELLKLKMPMKQTNLGEIREDHGFNIIHSFLKMLKKFINLFISIDPHEYNKKEAILYAEYSMNKNYIFDDDNSKFFTPTVRTLVIDFILHQTRWSEDINDLNSIGIQTLLEQNIYKAAYPLHDGRYHEEGTTRNKLRVEWANMTKWIRFQPLDEIKEYLGVKHGYYFSWLGFYTYLLIPASILGLLVFIYGFVFQSEDKLSAYVCNKGDKIVMCPMCDKTCDYWTLNESCVYTKLTYLFSNNFTVIFAFLMSLWATLFLELWKRHAAVLTHRWGLSDYTSLSEHPRSQYLAKLADAKKTKVNAVTNRREPIIPFWTSKLPTVLFSYTLVLFFILIVLCVVLSISLFKMWMQHLRAVFNNNSFWTKSMVTTVSASVLNLMSIMILNVVYQKVAQYLTSLELPRTQTDFENSLSIKLYVFQFVNYYASMMYIAFFKGKFVGYPGNFNRIFGFRQEECNAGGCLLELSIQLFIFMVGKQFLGAIMEMSLPAITSMLNHHKLKKNNEENMNDEDWSDYSGKQWCDDYKLKDWGSVGLFSDYLELAVQFGFVTLFASALPLAPLFALINNIFELRLDAKKILKYYRRPVPYPVPNIGVWYRITDVIGKIAVVFNAGIIAFSSDFIPRIIYFLIYIYEGMDVEFGEFPISKFNVKDFASESIPINPSINTSVCWFYGYREPPSGPRQYSRTVVYWEILASRLLFFIVFQNLVFLIKTAAQWLIPDVPLEVEEQKQREARLITDLIVSRETEQVLKEAQRGTGIGRSGV